jgi:hypothetical protein
LTAKYLETMLRRSKTSVEYQQQKVFRAIGTKQIANACRWRKLVARSTLGFRSASRQSTIGAINRPNQSDLPNNRCNQYKNPKK